MPGSPETVYVGLQGIVYYTTSARTFWTAATTSPAGIAVGACPQTLTPMNVVRNVNMTNSFAKADGSSRASNYKLVLQALAELGAEIDIPWTPTDPGFQALRNAAFGRYSIALAILDGSNATSGSQGIWADFAVTDFPRDEPIDKEMMSKVKVEPTPSAVPPTWVIVN